jgi:hypothetical protein
MKSHLSAYSTAKSHAVLSTGEVIRMFRELKGWTQAELARLRHQCHKYQPFGK